MVDELLIGSLLYGMFPLWIAAGFADYCFHRGTRIELTSGRRESALHAVQYVQIVAGVALAWFFEITALVLVAVIGLALLHLATGYLDIAYTASRRYISPPEQHVHSYMEILPLAATAALVILHWDSFVAIFADGAASWLVTPRQQALPGAAAAAVAAGFVAAGVAIVEELYRCRHSEAIGAM